MPSSEPVAQAEPDEPVDEVQTPPRRAVSTELSETVRVRINPAFTVITDELDAAIQRCSRSRDMERTVSLARMRNLSHASPREFDAMRARLADLLSAAAKADGSMLRFVSDEDTDAPFVLHGAAYLVTLEGFDSWELYLSLTRADRSHDMWRSEGPVRILRFEQPASPQPTDHSS